MNDPGSSPPRLTAKLTLLAASSLTVLAGAVVAPALPGIQRMFSSVDEIATLTRLVLTVPSLVIALSSAGAGYVADRYGRLPLLLPSLVGYAAAGTMGLYVADFWLLLASRALLGLAVAGVMTASTALIADLFDGAERTRFMGLQAAAMAAGGLLFVTGGGLLAEQSWRAPFSLYLLAVPLIPLALSSFAAHAKRPAPSTSASFGVSQELPKATPWLRVLPLYAAATFGMITFYLFPTQLPFLLSEELDASGGAVGVAIGCATVTSAVSAMVFGRVRAQIGAVFSLALVFLIAGPGLLGISVARTYSSVLASGLIAGLGFGLLMPNLSSWIADLSPPARRGRLLGGMASCLFLGQFASPIAAQAVMSHSTEGVREAFQVAGQATLTLGLAVALGGLAAKRRLAPN